MKIIIVSTLLAILLGITPALAINYDLQPYTTCKSDGFCYTALDVSSLGLNTARINNLKTVNITNFLNKVGTFINMGYNWTGNVLNVSGYINKGTSNYWSFSAGGDTFDPWWNVTNIVNSSWTNPATMVAPAGGSGYYFCLNFVPNTTVNLTGVEKNANDVSQKFRLVRWSDGVEIIAEDWVSNKYSTSTTLTSGVGYRFCLTDYSGNRYHNDTLAYPSAALYGSFVNGAYKYGGTYSNVTEWFGITKVNFSLATTNSTYYTWVFYVNGNTTGTVNVSNVTNNINMSIATNLSLNNTVRVNGTIYNSTLGSLTNMTTLNVGVWNITAYSNNSDVSTIWVNSTYTPPPAAVVYNFTYRVCADNTYLFKHNTNNTNGTFTYNDEYVFCDYGCRVYDCVNPINDAIFLFLLIIGSITVIYLILTRL